MFAAPGGIGGSYAPGSSSGTLADVEVRTEVAREDRGTAVTSRSVWTFDGHGRFRRTPRHGSVPSPATLPHGPWEEFSFAEFIYDRSAVLLRVVPSGRPEGSRGLLSSTVLWTNLDTNPGSLDGPPGPAGEWFAPSPVPADRDLWPGELPFTAFGQYGPDRLDLRVFDQDVYWVDRNGDPHRIDEMGEEYVTNVTTMLFERAVEFHAASVLRECAQNVGDALLGTVSAGLLVDELGVGSLASTDPTVWLASTPLVRRLLRPAS